MTVVCRIVSRCFHNVRKLMIEVEVLNPSHFFLNDVVTLHNRFALEA